LLSNNLGTSKFDAAFLLKSMQKFGKLIAAESMQGGVEPDFLAPAGIGKTALALAMGVRYMLK
jgi:hypothetical protein